MPAGNVSAAGRSWPGALPVATLTLLVMLDSALIAGDLLRRAGVLCDDRLLLTRERGYPEIFQYLKFGALAALLLIAGIRWRSVASLGWGMLFAFLLLDDALQIHERAGLMLAGFWALPALGALRPGDLGELLFFAVLGVAVVALAVVASRYGSSRDVTLGAVVLAGLAIVAVFGVGMDAVHGLARGSVLQPVAAVIEDGGELLATSLLAAAIVAVFVHSPPAGDGGSVTQPFDSRLGTGS